MSSFFDSIRNIVRSKAVDTATVPSATAVNSAELSAAVQTNQNSADKVKAFISGESIEATERSAFDQLVRSIRKGKNVSSKELLPFLCLERVADRIYVNYQLACVFHVAGETAKAHPFMQRAWNLAGPNEAMFEAFKTIQLALGNTTNVREAHKKLGLIAAARGDFSASITHFDYAHFTYSFYDHVDRWEYDLEMMSAIDKFAEAHRLIPSSVSRGSKIRIGYLVRGTLEVNSVLMRHLHDLVKHHDKEKFELFAFAPESIQEIESSAQGAAAMQKFVEYGATAVTGSNFEKEDRLAHLLAVAALIRDANLDLLVTSAGMVDFSQYFICALRLASVIVGLVQGPPAQFAPPLLDWSIAWSKHPLMDTPVDCTLVPWKGSAPAVAPEAKVIRSSFSVPENSCVILSGGRIEKFQFQPHWQAVAELLQAFPNLHYVVAGPTESQLSFLTEIFTEETIKRVHCLGWRNDFPQLVFAADIVLDTYPNGGGQALIEAMNAGVPIVAHRNNFMQLFDQTEWSPVEDFIDNAELLVPRGDFDAVKRVLSDLVKDSSKRKLLGSSCRDSIMRASTQEAVATCERLFETLVKAKRFN